MKNYGFIALLSLVPRARFSRLTDDYSDLIWEDERSCPTREEWEAEKSRLIKLDLLSECKEKAKDLIKEVDWIIDEETKPLLLNRNEFISYRSALRKLIVNPIENPEWPLKPKESWGEQ